jgi:hypothetical protein
MTHLTGRGVGTALAIRCGIRCDLEAVARTPCVESTGACTVGLPERFAARYLVLIPLVLCIECVAKGTARWPCSVCSVRGVMAICLLMSLFVFYTEKCQFYTEQCQFSERPISACPLQNLMGGRIYQALLQKRPRM